MAEYLTLKRNGDFRRAYAIGKCLRDPALVIYIVKNRAGCRRLGITAGKKIGGAVERNRARRIIKAAFCELAGELPDNFDFVFVARTRTCKMKSTQINAVMRRLLAKAGILKDVK